MNAKREAIRAIYAQVAAPDWAAPNLDALADVLRDLSWLPEGAIDLALPDLSHLDAEDRRALLDMLERAVSESDGSPHPVRVAPTSRYP